MNFPSTMANLTLHVGLPTSADGVAKYKADGGKLILVLSPDEKDKWVLGPNEQGFIWQSDKQIKRALFQNQNAWMGAQVVGNDEDRMRHFCDVLGDVMNLINFDTHSVKVLTKDQLPVKNALRNFRWVEDGVPLANAKGRGKGVHCIVIAAGPSLNQQWDELKRIRESEKQTMFIVAGRSYKKAMEMGVYPDMVVEVEQFEWDDKIFMFAKPPINPETLLAFPLTVCPGVPKAWPCEKMVLLDHNIAQMFGMRVREESIDGGNSILHHMVNLAIWLECPTITLAGADLGYPNWDKEKTHAEGTFHPWPGDIRKQEYTFQETVMVEANDGQMIHSSPAYVNFRTFLEMQVAIAQEKVKDCNIYTFSLHGQKVDGVSYIDIKEYPKCLHSNGQLSLPSQEVTPSPSPESPAAPSPMDVSYTGT